MELKKCKNGHFYYGADDKACPLCKCEPIIDGGPEFYGYHVIDNVFQVDLHDVLRVYTGSGGHVTIPCGIKAIGKAFENHTTLTSITIPDSVTSIGNSAFSVCTNLTDVYYTGSKDEWDAITLGSNNKCLTDANIHFASDSGDGQNIGNEKTSVLPDPPPDIKDFACLYGPPPIEDKKKSFWQKLFGKK